MTAFKLPILHPMCYHLVDGHVSGQVDADAAPYVLPLRGLAVIALTRVDGGVSDARAFSKQCQAFVFLVVLPIH